MKRVFLLLLVVCLAGAGTFYYVSSQADNFTGNFVGPMKVPGVGWTAARVKITRADKDFEISGTAGHYKRLPTEREWRLAVAQERIKHPRPPKQSVSSSKTMNIQKNGQTVSDKTSGPGNGKTIAPVSGKLPDKTISPSQPLLPPKPAAFSRPYPAPATYIWVEDLGATYQGKLVGEDLVLDAQMGFVFTAGKMRGTLSMPDGTIFKADTPENYQAVKDELREKLLQQEPGVIILPDATGK
ncbi:MAG: hypothetical protein LKF34_07780 [Acidaminococcaceae bacterium]|jgi:hypothetical protein|nr:hypothetical protein [Acidaminococcaceae bacterium]